MPDPPTVPVVDEVMNTDEVRPQVCVLKAEVGSLKTQAHDMRQCYHGFVGEVTKAFNIVDQSFQGEESRWDQLSRELHGLKTRLKGHTDALVDCKTHIAAPRLVIGEATRPFTDNADQIARTTQEKASYIQDTYVPGGVAGLQESPEG